MNETRWFTKEDLDEFLGLEVPPNHSVSILWDNIAQEWIFEVDEVKE